MFKSKTCLANIKKTDVKFSGFCKSCGWTGPDWPAGQASPVVFYSLLFEIAFQFLIYEFGSVVSFN